MARDDNDADRKIYFYRAFAADGTTPFKLDRAGIAAAIEALVGTDDFYLDEGQDKISCAEVVDDRAPQQIKLYAIRRENLPSRDNGAGVIDELNLRADEGLAEAIHIRLYPNNVIAAEFFFYGPRVSRLETFLNARCGQDVIIKPLLRHDAIKRVLKMKEVRALRIKINPSDITKQEAADLGLSGLLNQAKNFDAGVYADVTFRAGAADAGFTSNAKQFVRKVRDGHSTELFGNLEVSGKSDGSGYIEDVNILNEQLVRTAVIPRESARTRALDSPSAFRAIQTAYDDVKSDLPRDAVPN